MVLETELETYRRELPHLLEMHEGRFVLIHGDAVVDTFASNADAVTEGRRRFGFVPIFVKKIQRHESPIFITRNLTFKD